MLQLSEHEDVTPELPPQSGTPRRTFLGTFQATSTRRALLLTALGGLLIAGVVTALPTGYNNRLAGYAGSNPLSGAKGTAAFANAKSGSCLNWPDKSPDAATIVDCKGDHKFEVAESVDMRTYPGTEYGPQRRPAERRAHPADQPRAVPAGRRAVPRRQVRPEQQVLDQHAVVR